MNETQLHSNKLSLPKLMLKINRKVIVEIIQWLFFLLFLYSAGNKIFEFEKFRLELSKSPIISDFADYISYGIPAIETAIAVLVIIPRTSIIGLYASFSLMTMFTAYIFLIMNYNDNIPCSCNGILKSASWSQHLVFNVAFVVLGALGIFLQTNMDLHKIKQKS